MTKKNQKEEKINVSKMRLYSKKKGERLYLNTEERERFKAAALNPKRKREIATFALVLFYTGARITEALNIEYRHIDMSNKTISINTLKKRKQDYREIPIPDHFCSMLELVHEVSRNKKPSEKVWKVARNTAFLHIKKIFKEINIGGAKACPKGLRHSFGVHAILSKVQLNMLQVWMGHSHISTTSIYAKAQGDEARQIAKRMWN